MFTSLNMMMIRIIITNNVLTERCKYFLSINHIIAYVPELNLDGMNIEV
jgi:hypothetical protein